MSDPNLTARQELYCNLMSEIKGRLAVVAHLASNKSGLSTAARYESSYLQLRMMCEVLALACLTAHGDIPETAKLKTKWRAGEIISKLAKLHPKFYPQPVRPELSPDKQFLDGLSVLELNDKHLSREDLRSLYGICGDILHRGTLEDISPIQVNRDDLLKIAGWHNKFLHLLNHHYIETVDTKFGIYVRMQSLQKQVELFSLSRVATS